MEVFGAADVHPGASEDVGVGLVVVFEHLVHEVVEAEGLVIGDEVEHFGVHGVDAHAAGEVERGFFAEADDTVAGAGLENAEGDVDLFEIGADGEWAAEGLVLAEEFGEVEVGEEIAIHDEEGAVEAIDEFDGAHRTQWLIFTDVIDVESPSGTIATMEADHVAEVANADGNVAEALVGELAEHDFEDRHAAHGHEWLGQDFGVGVET